jgi:hypothetical protein
MKRIIIGLVIALASAQTASANGIRSPLGVSQAEWNASETYKNFACPENTSRGEGVDMNFTATRSDDFYFVKCEAIVIRPTPVIETITATAPTPVTQIPAQTPTQETPTVTSKTDTVTVVTKVDTATVLTDTKTVTSILDEELDLTWDWDKIMAWIVAWFEKIWIRL